MRSDVKRSTDSAARCSPSLAAVGASGRYGDPGRGVSGSYGGTGRGVSGSYGQGAGGANLARSQATRDGKKRNTTERQLPPARSGVRCHFSRGFVCI